MSCACPFPPSVPISGAQRHPFSFILRAAGDLEYSLSTNLNLLPVFTELATARERWWNVHIKLLRMTDEILDLITLGDAPLLQNMKCEMLVHEHRLPIPLRMLHCCPRLESFRWNSSGSPLLLPNIDISLTSLSLGTTLSVSECITILRLSPRLFSAKLYTFYSSDPSPTPHLTHPTLSTLTTTGKHFPAFLAALTLPALLDLDLTVESTQWDVELSAFLTRSKPTLRRLSLTMTFTQSHNPALLRILTLTPHLRSLRLVGFPPCPSPFTATLVRALYPSPLPGASLCPRLQNLELSGIQDCPDGLCSAMLRARWGAQTRANGVACLEEGYITLKGGLHERDRTEMKELCAEGMQVELYWRVF